MPKPIEVIQWYKKNDLPIECRYCRGTKDLTKDHIIPKHRVPYGLRKHRYNMKKIDPVTYYSQFALCCVVCNQMKGWMDHEQFIAHLAKIIKNNP